MTVVCIYIIHTDIVFLNQCRHTFHLMYEELLRKRVNPFQMWNISFKESKFILKRQHFCRRCNMFLNKTVSSLNRYVLWKACCCPSKLSWYWKHTIFLREHDAYPCKTCYISMMRGFLSRRCTTVLRKKRNSPVNQKCCFRLFTRAFKTCDKEANTSLSFEYGATGQNWISIISSIHWLTIFHSKSFCIAVILQYSQTKFYLTVLMGLLSGPCSLLLPNVQATASSAVTTASEVS